MPFFTCGFMFGLQKAGLCVVLFLHTVGNAEGYGFDLTSTLVKEGFGRSFAKSIGYMSAVLEGYRLLILHHPLLRERNPYVIEMR